MTATTTHDAARGREASKPSEIPKPGWKDVAWRVKDQLNDDNVSMIAAGVAFYAMLAVFPALAALVAIYGLFADPQTIAQHIEQLGTLMPQQALQIIEEQLKTLSQSSQSALSAGAAVGVLISLWSATKGTKAVITALNIAYDEREARGFVKLTLVAFGLTLFAVAFVIVAMLLIAGIPAVLNTIGLDTAAAWAAKLLRWPLLIVLVLAALAVLYRYAPSRDKPQWRWLSPGAVVAGVIWMLGSIGFSIYVSYFDSYDKTYGSLAAVVLLMMWMYLSAYAVLIGAEFNAEMERQTRKDTTEGRPEPMGRRDAHAADTLGESKGGGSSGSRKSRW